MNERALRYSATALIFCVAYACTGEAPVKNSTSSYRLFSETAEEVIGSAYLQWPATDGLSSLRTNKVPSEATFFGPVRTIRAVLQDRWLPPDLPDRLIPLKHAVDGFDAVVLRYEKDGHLLQIVQTSFRIGVAIKPTGDASHLDGARDSALQEQEQLVRSTLRSFFNQADEIEKLPLDHVTSTNVTFAGKSELVSSGHFGGRGVNWWNSLYWWTDGKTVGIVAGKPTPSTEPIEVKDWF